MKKIESNNEAKSLCKVYNITKAKFNNWRKKYSRMETHQLQRIKELEEENRTLKKMYADISLDNSMLKDFVVMLKDLLGKKS
ncbi:transposase [uncultured Carboxylicivirga sp.]|uniref:transposase n=1 Tax=uncultured Carboxylicivirga sp. TaxID=1628156 RepID=UPI0026212D58|nr:transposase [uncultured Carboxylicivirga sp.]